jgi:hypothetical protein
VSSAASRHYAQGRLIMGGDIHRHPGGRKPLFSPLLISLAVHAVETLITTAGPAVLSIAASAQPIIMAIAEWIKWL